MMTRGLRSPWGLRTIRRFNRDRSGVAAIEFGFVALPFFAIMFAIVGTGFSFFANQILQTATSDAARLIMTGQSQLSSMTQADFTKQICNRLPQPLIFDCKKLQIDVRTYTAFANSDASLPIVNGAIKWTPQYNPGTSSDIVVVRAIYPIPAFTNFYGITLANTNDGNIVLLATAVFRNEPYI